MTRRATAIHRAQVPSRTDGTTLDVSVVLVAEDGAAPARVVQVARVSPGEPARPVTIATPDEARAAIAVLEVYLRGHDLRAEERARLDRMS